MRQKLTLLAKTMLLLCALMAGSGSAWGEDSETVTMNNASSITGTDVTFSFAKGSGTNAPALNNSKTRLYPGNTMTISSTTKKIEKVDFEFACNNGGSGNNKACPTGVTVSTGTETFGTLTTSSTNATWQADNDNTASVTITIEGAKGNLTFSTAKVYYIETSSDPSSAVSFNYTTPSINFPATTTYSQVATTATGYTGTVTYEITANTAGASISGSTVTVTQEGSVTVKATAPAITGWAKSEASYTLTVNDTRSENGLAYAESEQELTVGEVLSAPTLTNPNNLAVMYSSEDETIATVDALGNVTGVAIGTTNIIATFDGNDTYKAGSVSYSLTVKKASVSATDGVFDFTYADEIDYGTGLQPTTGDIKVAKTFTAGNITLTPEPTANNKYWRWYTGTTNTLRLYTDTKMTIAAADGYVITKIEFTGTQNLDAVTVSAGNYEAASDKKSATWTGCANSIVFTRAGSNPFYTGVTVTYGPSYKQTVSSYGWATLIAPDVPVSFAENTAYVVSAADVDNKTITVSPVTSVPAGTPVLLKGEGEKTITVVASASAPESNLLQVCDGTAAATGYNYFVLAQDGTSAAFMQWTGSLDDVTGKVVLPLELDLTSGGARSLRIIDSKATGISQIENGKRNIDNQFYNLNGQRMSSPQKGLYIVNGKKVMMK